MSTSILKSEHNKSPNQSIDNHLWHGIDFQHPIHSLQQTHPVVFVAFLLGLYVTYIVIFATIADVVSHVK